MIRIHVSSDRHEEAQAVKDLIESGYRDGGLKVEAEGMTRLAVVQDVDDFSYTAVIYSPGRTPA